LQRVNVRVNVSDDGQDRHGDLVLVVVRDNWLGHQLGPSLHDFDRQALAYRTIELFQLGKGQEQRGQVAAVAGLPLRLW
jgi:hypothetical protein